MRSIVDLLDCEDCTTSLVLSGDIFKSHQQLVVCRAVQLNLVQVPDILRGLSG